MITDLSITVHAGSCYFCRLKVPLEWNGKSLTETVAWFQYESDPSLNSNVYEVAQQLVQKHFPGKSTRWRNSSCRNISPVRLKKWRNNSCR